MCDSKKAKLNHFSGKNLETSQVNVYFLLKGHPDAEFLMFVTSFGQSLLKAASVFVQSVSIV